LSELKNIDKAITLAIVGCHIALIRGYEWPKRILHQQLEAAFFFGAEFLQDGAALASKFEIACITRKWK
jgi:hypothetical protein